jgi:(2R)-sulfolactate sulfo-lyase subunit alpha
MVCPGFRPGSQPRRPPVPAASRRDARIWYRRAHGHRMLSPEDRLMSIPHCLVHSPKDTVGVVVVDGLKAGTDMLVQVTDNDTTLKLKAKMDIPIGHKVALVDIKKGDTIWKYGEDIGKAVAAIKKVEHAHVQNIKTKRW